MISGLLVLLLMVIEDINEFPEIESVLDVHGKGFGSGGNRRGGFCEKTPEAVRVSDRPRSS